MKKLALLALLTTFGCGDADTWLLLQLSQGIGVPAQLGSVEFQMTLTSGLPATASGDLAGSDGGAPPPDLATTTAPTTMTAIVTLNDVTLPTSVSFQIAKGEGRLDVTVIARDTNGVELRRERGTVQIQRGRTAKLALSIGTPIVTNDGNSPVDLSVPGDAGPQDLIVAPVADLTEPAKLQILPANRNYGSLLINQATAEQTFNVTNIGGQPTGMLTATVSNNDFSIGNDLCTTVSLSPGMTCTVGAAFTPKSAGTKAAQLTVTNGLQATSSANLSGEGTAPGALGVTPSSHPFADTKINEQSTDTATLTVTNSGGVATGVLNVTIESVSDAADFTIQTNTCLVSLDASGGANDSCSVGVRFVPKTRGDKFATIKISDGTLSAVSSVNGKALEAVIAVTPLRGDADFGQLSGCNDGYLAVQIVNSGNAPTGNLQFSVTGSDTAGFTLMDDYCINDSGQQYNGTYACVTNIAGYQVSVPSCPTTNPTLAGGAKCQKVIRAYACSWSASTNHMATVNVTAAPGGTGMVTFMAAKP